MNHVALRIHAVKRPVSGQISGFRVGLYVQNLTGMATDPRTGNTYRAQSWHKGYRIHERESASITPQMIQRVLGHAEGSAVQVHVQAGITLPAEIDAYLAAVAS